MAQCEFTAQQVLDLFTALTTITGKIDVLESKVDYVKERVDVVETRVGDVEGKVDGVQVTSNEISSRREIWDTCTTCHGLTYTIGYDRPQGGGEVEIHTPCVKCGGTGKLRKGQLEGV